MINSTKELVQSSRDILASKNAKVPKDEDDLDDDDEESTATNPPPILFHLDEKSIKTLDSVVDEVETWLTEKIAQQEQLKLWEEPVLLLTDLEKRSNQIQSVLRKVFMDQAKTKTASKTSSTSSTAKSSSTTEIVSTKLPSDPTDAPKSEDPVYVEDEDMDDLDRTATAMPSATETTIENVEATPATGRKHEEL
jgi:hypoxia up-regulated 1